MASLPTVETRRAHRSRRVRRLLLLAAVLLLLAVAAPDTAGPYARRRHDLQLEDAGPPPLATT